MDQRTTIYANKAEKYAQHRWDYQSDAIRTIFERAGLTKNSIIADVGAGTGILTRHFVGQVGWVYAIEPNQEMRQQTRRSLAEFSAFSLLDTCAEATGLPDHALDLICAAQAIHWFDPQPTRREFQRILKPGGWLAIIWNTSSASPLTAALGAISTPEYGFQPVHAAPAADLPPEAYYGGAPYERMRWPFTYEQTWDGFLGALLSASFTPDETHALYPRFEQAAREIFAQHSRDGRLSASGETHLFIGKIRGETQ